MKKTLAAVAVLGAFAGSALAADVTLYGVVDAGLNYTHFDADQVDVDATNSLTMDSGIQSGSRFGLKGTEDLGNGLVVGFVLENGFSSDTGTLGQGNRLFGREANLFLRSDFGEFSMGRVGSLVSGNGSYGLVGGLSPFGTSFGDHTAQVNTVMSFALGGRLDNTVTYKSPTFAGVNVYAQYSFGTDVDAKATPAQVEGKASANRYYAVGATYNNGPMNAVLTVDSINYATQPGDNVDDSYTVTLGGSYNFDVVKAYAGVQYFDNARASDFAGMKEYQIADKTLKGYGFTLGLDAPILGGTGMAAIGYLDGEDAADRTVDVNRIVGSVGFSYPFSKRTNVYSIASYGQDESKTGTDSVKPTYAKIAVGLRHKF